MGAGYSKLAPTLIRCSSPIPSPTSRRHAPRRLALRVTAAAQRALRQGHPWLFDQAIVSQSGEGRPGDLAVIFDDYRRFLAIGLYDPTSPLRVRILQHATPAAIDRAWLAGKLAAAAAWRATLPATGTTGYRLVHGENDGLPGLVVDRYEDDAGRQALHPGLAALAGRSARRADRGHTCTARKCRCCEGCPRSNPERGGRDCFVASSPALHQTQCGASVDCTRHTPAGSAQDAPRNDSVACRRAAPEP